MMINIKPGLNGLPPVKKEYDENEKKKIVEAAEESDLKLVAKVYGLTWQKVAGWRTSFAHQRTAQKKAAQQKTAQLAEQKSVQVIIQSPDGKEITISDILEKVGNVDVIYVRVDENAAYWVRGEEHGSVQLW